LINPFGASNPPVTAYSQPQYQMTAAVGSVVSEVRVDSAVVAGGIGSASYTYTFPPVTANHSIEARFNNEAPIAEDGSLFLMQGAGAQGGQLGGSDPEGGALTYEVLTPAQMPGSSVWVNPTTGAYTYTPADAGAVGADTFTFRVRDPGGLYSNVATVQVTISPCATVSLNPGLNLFRYPVDLPPGLTAWGLYTALGGAAVVENLQRVAGQEVQSYPGTSFDVDDQTGYYLSMWTDHEVLLCGPPHCPSSYTLTPGTNVLALECVPEAYTSYDLLLHIEGAVVDNPPEVTSIQRFNPETGAFETTSFMEGEPVGQEFPIQKGESCIIHMRNGKAVTAP